MRMLIEVVPKDEMDDDEAKLFVPPAERSFKTLVKDSKIQVALVRARSKARTVSTSRKAVKFRRTF